MASQCTFDLQPNNVVNVFLAPKPLEKLHTRVAVGAIHDSAERCGAPKCHADTRVAVRDDLYSRIVDNDRELENPRKIIWVTGPANSGKTAVMGSLADRCATDGILGATFFFASWASIDRRRKTALVATIAYQLAHYNCELRYEISKAIEKNPDIVDGNLDAQMEALILMPLRQIAARPSAPKFRGVVIIDGLDECEATSDGPQPQPARTKEPDQREILEVLLKASSDPSFPFRILIATRAERVFREFFDSGRGRAPSIAQKLDLQDYNAAADIIPFLESQFDRIRRRYSLPPSWPPPGTIPTLAKNASGQFTYVATIIQLLDCPSPGNKLESILDGGLASRFDFVYHHILQSISNPELTVQWLLAIRSLLEQGSSTLCINLFLQGRDGDAEEVLGGISSLVRIPAAHDEYEASYKFYFEDIFDFLNDRDRSGEFYIENEDRLRFYGMRYLRICLRNGSVTETSDRERFLDFFFGLTPPRSLPTSQCLTQANVDWWATECFTRHGQSPEKLFKQLHAILEAAHRECHSTHCKPACKLWKNSVKRRLRPSAAARLTWRAIPSGDRLRQMVDAHFSENLSAETVASPM